MAEPDAAAVTGVSVGVEVSKFNERSDVLLTLFRDTRASLVDIQACSKALGDEGLLYTFSTGHDDPRSVKRLIDQRPRFIILGSSSTSCASIVNHILGVPLLPFLDETEEWRSYRISYSDNGIPCENQTYSGGSLVSATNLVINSIQPELAPFSPTSPSPLFAFDVPPVLDLSIHAPPPLHSDSEDSSMISSDDDSASASISPRSSTTAEFVDICVKHPLLAAGTDVVVPRHVYASTDDFAVSMYNLMKGCLPVFIYSLSSESMVDVELDFIAELRNLFPQSPVMFVSQRYGIRCDLPESERYPPQSSIRHTQQRCCSVESLLDTSVGSSRDSIFKSLCDLGLLETGDTGAIGDHNNNGAAASLSSLNDIDKNSRSAFNKVRKRSSCSALGVSVPAPGFTAVNTIHPPSDLSESLDRQRKQHVLRLKLKSVYVDRLSDLLRCLLSFTRQIFQTHFICAAGRLHDMHARLLNVFIITAFDMARDQVITPKRLSFAKQRESEMFGSLMQATNEEQERMRQIIESAIEEMRPVIAQAVTNFPPLSVYWREDSEQVQSFVIQQLNERISDKVIASLGVLRATFIDTITRSLESLEYAENIASTPAHEKASVAFKRILDAANNIEITMQTGRSVMQLLWDRMQQAYSDVLLPCYSCYSIASKNDYAQLDEDDQSDTLETTPTGSDAAADIDSARIEYRCKIANKTLDRLTHAKLTRSVCNQIRDHLKSAHDAFCSAMSELECYHRTRLTGAEKYRLTLRKQYAPKLARLAMESLAQRDSLLRGMPRLGPEIGRGQYGVVYACDKWGGHNPCAVKSVVPPDEKHWNDLALEFFYTKSLPLHKRVVRLHGAVIDHNYGGGMGLPAVLLVMERLKRDLYTGIRSGLPWQARLRIAIDVVEGIRFLHSQGLVHRDIKLKNVLLDEGNRGKVTDLGFCKPEAMMSGSVVGTPIHMAPELFTGSYDSSVDVYAFGVLLWYICSGHVRLPQAFECCASKDQLWSSVRKGIRPEVLPEFDPECQEIMMACWSGESSRRPHLGSVQPRLEKLLRQHARQNLGCGSSSSIEQSSAIFNRRVGKDAPGKRKVKR